MLIYFAGYDSVDFTPPLTRQEGSDRDCVGADPHPGDDALPGDVWYHASEEIEITAKQ